MSFAVKFNIVLGPLFQTGLQTRSRTDITLFTVLYGYGYVKSVDSMDNVNSVRCGNGLDNVNSTNSAVIRGRGGAAGMKGALLSTVSMLLTIGPALRTLLILSMLSTLLT